MYSVSVKLENASGLSGKAASLFAREAKKYAAKVAVLFGDASANGKSVSPLTALGAVRGSKVEIRADGEDEEKACEALKALIAGGLGEK